MRGLEALLGLGAIIAGIIIYTGPRRVGGILAAFAGILLLVITAFAMPAILVFAAGSTRDHWSSDKGCMVEFWKH